MTVVPGIVPERGDGGVIGLDQVTDDRHGRLYKKRPRRVLSGAADRGNLRLIP